MCSQYVISRIDIDLGAVEPWLVAKELDVASVDKSEPQNSSVSSVKSGLVNRPLVMEPEKIRKNIKVVKIDSKMVYCYILVGKFLQS